MYPLPPRPPTPAMEGNTTGNFYASGVLRAAYTGLRNASITSVGPSSMYSNTAAGSHYRTGHAAQNNGTAQRTTHFNSAALDEINARINARILADVNGTKAPVMKNNQKDHPMTNQYKRKALIRSESMEKLSAANPGLGAYRVKEKILGRSRDAYRAVKIPQLQSEPGVGRARQGHRNVTPQTASLGRSNVVQKGATMGHFGVAAMVDNQHQADPPAAPMVASHDGNRLERVAMNETQQAFPVVLDKGAAFDGNYFSAAAMKDPVYAQEVMELTALGGCQASEAPKLLMPAAASSDTGGEKEQSPVLSRTRAHSNVFSNQHVINQTGEKKRLEKIMALIEKRRPKHGREAAGLNAAAAAFQPDDGSAPRIGSYNNTSAALAFRPRSSSAAPFGTHNTASTAPSFQPGNGNGSAARHGSNNNASATGALQLDNGPKASFASYNNASAGRGFSQAPLQHGNGSEVQFATPTDLPSTGNGSTQYIILDSTGTRVAALPSYLIEQPDALFRKNRNGKRFKRSSAIQMELHRQGVDVPNPNSKLRRTLRREALFGSSGGSDKDEPLMRSTRNAKDWQSYGDDQEGETWPVATENPLA